MDVDQKPIVPRVRDLDTNFIDDDDLQAALARSRRAKLHKAKKQTPEDLAQRSSSFRHSLEYLLTSILFALLVAEQRDQQEADAQETINAEERDSDLQEGPGGRLTFDDTSEFVRAVGNNPVVKPEPKEVSVARSPAPRVTHRSPSREVSMAPGDEAMDELEAGEVVVKDEEEDLNMEMLDDLENAIKTAEAEEGRQNGNVLGDAMGGTSAEQTFSSGMASTLNILRQQGILAAPAADDKERERTQLQRDLWLADQRRRVSQRELEKLQSRGANKDQAQREYENRLREQQEARDNLEAFRNYKPDVNIVYYDEHGRSLTPKEAWKALSHKFHGKGSGKMKTEKRLKKIAEEKKQAAMASGDTPLSMNSAFQQRQMKAGQAHFVLSVGNRGYVFQKYILYVVASHVGISAVPQAAEFLDAQPLAKGKTEKAKKKKEGKAAQQAMESGFMTLPAPQLQSMMNGGSPAPSGFSSVAPNSSSASPVPSMKPGFSRISSVVDSPSQGGTPGPNDRSKVTFGFGTKRKAGEEAFSPPPQKRR